MTPIPCVYILIFKSTINEYGILSVFENEEQAHKERDKKEELSKRNSWGNEYYVISRPLIHNAKNI